MKQPRQLLFFKGVFYEFTYNEDGNPSQSQICLLFDLPDQSRINLFKKITVLVAPPGIKYMYLEPEKMVDDYISDGWVLQKVGTAPQCNQQIPDRLCA